MIPMWTDRPPGAYRPLLETALTAPLAPEPSNGQVDHTNGTHGTNGTRGG